MSKVADKYASALKEVRASKQKELRMLIKFDYNNHFVLPFKAAVQFLEAMEHAEHMCSSYSSPYGIQPMKRDHFSMEPLSGEEYENNKIAALLNVSVDDIQMYKRNMETTE